MAQEIADQHGRDLVVELPEEVEPEAERDVPEGNGEGSRENALGRSSYLGNATVKEHKEYNERGVRPD